MDPDSIWLDVFGFGAILFIVSYLSYIVYYAAGLYGWDIFHRTKSLSEDEKDLLRSKIHLISIFSERTEQHFFSRVAWFRSKKPFIYKGNVKKKNNIELLISAGAILTTLGLRDYKFIRSVQKVVIYPTDYYSIITKKHHVGEYNVGLKTVVFSVDRLVSGFEVADDNINLAIHEFAHALCFETHGKNTWEAIRFQWGFKKLQEYRSDTSKMKVLSEAKYFREYGKHNVFEFFSVLAENFIETPIAFDEHYPELYGVLKKMLNMDFR